VFLLVSTARFKNLNVFAGMFSSRDFFEKNVGFAGEHRAGDAFESFGHTKMIMTEQQNLTRGNGEEYDEVC